MAPIPLRNSQHPVQNQSLLIEFYQSDFAHLERQHTIFLIAVAAVFGALIAVALYFNPLQKANKEVNDPNVIKAKVGQSVYVRYSKDVVKRIQDLPSKNNVTLKVSSELQNIDLGGLRGELRYDELIISYVQKGKVETETGDTFKTVEYRFSPDRGNTTTYTYENAKFTTDSQDSQLIATVKPLPTAQVGEHYTVKLKLETGQIVNYAISDKVIEIVP